MKTFPTRTLVLMVLALLAFGWMWWQTHRLREATTTPTPANVTDVKIITSPGGDR